jgi:predicted nucleic acid-binding protein
MASVMTRWERQLSSLRRIAFDSNALIYLLAGMYPYAPYVGRALAMVGQGTVFGILSTVVEMEILVKPFREHDARAQDQAELILRQTPNLTIRPVDRTIARRAAELRARTGLRPLDALIAATALEEQCDAIIGNDHQMARHLIQIPYLCLDDYIP